MPTNVTAEYVAAELHYQKSKTPEEKIKALENMYREVPKHKGTEKLQQEIKTRLAKYKRQVEKEEKQKAKGFQISVKKEGFAQIVLVGPPNSGKSTILSKLTNAKPNIADYPFTTKMPEVAIMYYDKVKLQIVEMPAIAKGSATTGKGPQFFSITRNADLILIVTDTSDLDDLFNEFEEANIKLNEKAEDKFVSLKGIIVQNKTDLDSDKIFEKLCRYYRFKLIKICAYEDKDIEKLKKEIWKSLGLIRIYTKEPGKKPTEIPFCLKKGSNVESMAKKIHKDFIKKFRFARVWGKSAKFPEQMVGLEHVLKDKDIIEFHMR